MSSRSQADRIAALPIPEEQLIDGLAEALYMTHYRGPPAPEWENLSDNFRDWVKEQARIGLGYLRGLQRPWR